MSSLPSSSSMSSLPVVERSSTFLQTASSSSCNAIVTKQPSSSPTPPAATQQQQQQQQQQHPPPKTSLQLITTSWTQFTSFLHYGIIKCVLTLSLAAARNPKRCVGLVSFLSVFLLGTGLLTNFTLSLDDEEIYAPNGCRPLEHWDYVTNVQGFPKPMRPLIMVFHRNGDNVLGDHAYEGLDLVFEANDLVKNLPGYEFICSLGECKQQGPTRYWDQNHTLYQLETQGSNLAVMETISQDEFWAAQSYMFGKLETEPHDNNNGTTIDLITYAESFFSVIEFPAGDNGEAEAFELEIIDLMMEFRDNLALNSTGTGFRVDFYVWRSVPDELARAVFEDIPLIPFVFIIMTAFTCLVFSRKDKVQSRSILGVGSVVTIVCSIMSGYGLAFIIGLPFTSMTQILPFVIFGVGLDDTFIITGAYFRTDPSQDPVERIRHTMEDVGSSISLTTTTTVIAFILGWISSSIPCIQWICLYAFPTILIDFIYQITFFVAILVLDERRIEANRRDCCCWIIVEPTDDTEDDDDDEHHDNAAAIDAAAPEPGSNNNLQTANHEPVKPKASPIATDRFMEWYSEQLLRPHVKIAVLVVFTIFVAACVYSATLLEQDFKPSEFLPDGSYAYAFIESSDLYTTQKLQVKAYFRHVDQSDPEIQRQMIQYINDLSDMPQINRQPDFCWVRDFQRIREGSDPMFEPYAYLFDESTSNLTFSQQLDLILSVPEINELYGPDIARDENGNIEASKCNIIINGVDLDEVQEQIDMLADQRAVTAAQPINQGRKDFAFFNLDLIYYIWEFYTVAIHELIFTTVSGVIAVSFIAFVLIPHKTAIMFVLPLMMLLYVDLLGTLQFAGLAINPITYICLVMSIGLLVDFLLHLILRYYESTETTREGKVKDTLKTMGSSIFVGGMSTLLGVVPLAFSSSGIIKTVFTMFFAMVALGLANGLILLPVILSYVGPTVSVRMNHHHHSQAKQSNMDDRELRSADDQMDSQTTGSTSTGDDASRQRSSSSDSSFQPSSSSSSRRGSGGHDRTLSYQNGAWIHHVFTDEEIEV